MFDMIKSNPFLWLIIFLAVVAPSFLVGAMKVIFYIVIAIVLLFVILGFVFRVKIKNMQSRMEEQMRGGASGRQHTNYNTPDEGDVKVYKTSQTQEKKVSKDVGDYVDFEEIKK